MSYQMSDEMKQKLEPFFMPERAGGTYNTHAIAAEFDVQDTDDDPLGLDATLLGYFGDEEQQSPELRAAKAYNVAKAEAREREAVQNSLETPEAQRTESQWRALVNAGLAEEYAYESPFEDYGQGGIWYRMRTEVPKDELLFADETEEDLASRGL